MGWICVLNPSEQMFKNLKHLIDEAYEYVKEKYVIDKYCKKVI